MNLFDVYTLWNIEPVRAAGCRVWDKNDTEYLDFYGGHAVISIGHSHPEYIRRITEQINRIGFYSNSVQNSLQEELAEKLGALSQYPNYSLFLCNSGAEANENALKLASFNTGRSRVLAFRRAFHGRTSGAVAATDNATIVAPFNANHQITFVPLNDIEAAIDQLKTEQYAAVIIEGIQGVAGIFEPSNEFLVQLKAACQKYGTTLILDEIQSGYGRTGQFFAHQQAGIEPDIITVAKGMGNGFPIGGVMVAPHIEPKKGMLGTTFGGNHLACAAAIAVLDVMRNENLIQNAAKVGQYLIDSLSQIPATNDIRGRGLMIGIQQDTEQIDLRNRLLFEEHIFTGGAKNNVMRLLPPLCVTQNEADILLDAIRKLTADDED